MAIRGRDSANMTFLTKKRKWYFDREYKEHCHTTILNELKFIGTMLLVSAFLFIALMVFSTAEAFPQEPESDWRTYHNINNLHELTLGSIMQFFKHLPDSTITLSNKHRGHKDYRDLFYWITSERVDKSERNWLIVTIEWAEGIGEDRFKIKPEDIKESDFIHYVNLLHEVGSRPIQKP